MPIQVLDQSTINQIAAGEVVERPASVVKELLENAIDAGSSAVTVEIRGGGVDFIRITDNGCGIRKEEIPLAFLRHSTSKIKSAEDLMTVSSLGFRGEALSSIAAVSQVELITKQADSFCGYRYRIEGGNEVGLEEVGVPDGTTIISRNLFYNTPARRKFLKTAATEAGHVTDFVEKIALSHPEISIRLIVNGQNKLHTAGNHNLKDLIYTIFGRELTANITPFSVTKDFLKITGFIGKPTIARSNRSFENYFINGRFIKSSMISKAIEDGYRTFLMMHKYPFTMLHFEIEPELIDVNVHPSKMELRFKNGEEMYQIISSAIIDTLSEKELIPMETLPEQKDTSVSMPQIMETPKPVQEEKKTRYPEPFENTRDHAYQVREEKAAYEAQKKEETPYRQQEMKEFMEEAPLLTEAARPKHKLIGQVFDTYWIVQYENEMYIIDQHAAHEKVLFEENYAAYQKKEHASQLLNPPCVVTLSMREQEVLKQHLSVFESVGYEIEHFGGNEFAIRGIPVNLYYLDEKELFLEILDSLSEEGANETTDTVYYKIATMSCKAAVKGNQRLSTEEANELIDRLLKLENPYLCPHGRPTIISFSKYELEKKFKRVL